MLVDGTSAKALSGESAQPPLGAVLLVQLSRLGDRRSEALVAKELADQEVGEPVFVFVGRPGTLQH